MRIVNITKEYKYIILVIYYYHDTIMLLNQLYLD